MGATRDLWLPKASTHQTAAHWDGGVQIHQLDIRAKYPLDKEPEINWGTPLAAGHVHVQIHR